MLSTIEQERYSRHLLLDNFGESGQEKMLQGKVLLVGAGGLGCPVLQYLTAMGIGHIGVMDADRVSLSNLQRQILFSEDEIGQLKVEVACAKMAKLNSSVHFETYPFFLDEQNGDEIVSNYDVIVGATDNFASRILMDKLSKKHQVPFVHGSILEYEGQVSVFNYQSSKGYVDVFGDLDSSHESSLSIAVIGTIPGIIGSMMANEVVKVLLESSEVLASKLLIYDALKCNFKLLKY
jgi:molybdopterin/thiamine biosynthesis adenylyltransferase